MSSLATIPTRQARRVNGGLAGPLRVDRPRRGIGAVSRPPAVGERVGVDPLLTADDVAQLLGMTKAWVYAETRANRIPHIPLGRYVRFRRSAVLQWISALERDAAGDGFVRGGGR